MKKYKRAEKVVNWRAAGSSVLSAAFSSASFGSALSVVGLPATIPLGGQTERALKTRISEPKKAVLMFDHNSKLACHVHEYHHHE